MSTRIHIIPQYDSSAYGIPEVSHRVNYQRDLYGIRDFGKGCVQYV